jgi:hypothetical protein
VLQPLCAVGRGAGIDQDRLGAGDDHRVDVEQANRRRRQQLRDDIGIGRDPVGTGPQIEISDGHGFLPSISDAGHQASRPAGLHPGAGFRPDSQLTPAGFSPGEAPMEIVWRRRNAKRAQDARLPVGSPGRPGPVTSPSVRMIRDLLPNEPWLTFGPPARNHPGLPSPAYRREEGLPFRGSIEIV